MDDLMRSYPGPAPCDTCPEDRTCHHECRAFVTWVAGANSGRQYTRKRSQSRAQAGAQHEFLSLGKGGRHDDR